MRNRFRSFLADERGQDLIEYALLAAFIAIVSIAALNTLGGSVKALYTKVNEAFN